MQGIHTEYAISTSRWAYNHTKQVEKHTFLFHLYIQMWGEEN